MPIPTPLHERTAELCTSFRWKDWAGHPAVCFYGDCHEPEYHAIRHAAGLLDVSPLFKYRITGTDAAEFLSWVGGRDVRRLGTSRVTYVCLMDHRGDVIDDGTIARFDEARFRLTTASPSLHWLLEHARGFDVDIADESSEVAAMAVQGPTSRRLLASVTDLVDGLRFFGAAEGDLDGRPVQITRTGFTGDLGYEIWVHRDDAIAVWDAVMDAGRDFGLLPVGLDALDMARVEAGFILQDVDYFSSIREIVPRHRSTPFEVGLGWTVDMDREPFIGRDGLRRRGATTPRRCLVGLDIDWPELQELHERSGLIAHVAARAWRDAVPVYDGDRQIGKATSGTWSPILKRNIALASVAADRAEPGTRIKIEQTVDDRRCKVTARVVERPFFDPERKRAR